MAPLRWMSSCPLFFLLFLIGVAESSLAQEGLHAGAGLGFHNSWLANRDDRKDEEIQGRFTPGASTSIYLAYYIKPSIAVTVEGIFSFQGQNYFIDGRYRNKRTSTRLTYLKTPLMLEFRASFSEGAFVKGHFGPYLSMVQGASRSVEGDPVDPRPSASGWEQAYRSPVFGAMVGVGPGIRWGRRGLASTLELRFDHDLTNAEEKASPIISNFRDETYNVTLGFMVRLRYAFQEQAAKNKSGYP